MIRASLPRFGRFEAWRDAARVLASARIPPGDVTWGDPDAPADLFGADPMPAPGDAPSPRRAISWILRGRSPAIPTPNASPCFIPR